MVAKNITKQTIIKCKFNLKHSFDKKHYFKQFQLITFFVIVIEWNDSKGINSSQLFFLTMQE